MQYPVGSFFEKHFKIDVYITDKYFVCLHNVHVYVWVYKCVQNKIIGITVTHLKKIVLDKFNSAIQNLQYEKNITC